MLISNKFFLITSISIFIISLLVFTVHILSLKTPGCNLLQIEHSKLILPIILLVIIVIFCIITGFVIPNSNKLDLQNSLNKLRQSIGILLILISLTGIVFGTIETYSNFQKYAYYEQYKGLNTAETLYSSNDYNAFPKVLKLKNGTLWCVWYNGNWHVDTNNNGKLLQSFSHDNGTTWSNPTLIYNDPNWDTRNMIIGQLDNDSLICTYWLYDYNSREQKGLQWVVSNNFGQSWSTPKSITSEKYNPAEDQIYTWMSPFGDIFRYNGKILAPFYGGDSEELNNNVVLLEYNDAIDEWNYYGVAMHQSGNTYNEAKIVNLEGFLLCIARGTGNILHYAYSENSINWSVPVATTYEKGHAPELIPLEKIGDEWKFFCSYRGEAAFLRGGFASFNVETKIFTCENRILHVSSGNGGGDCGYSSGVLLNDKTVGFVNYEVIMCGNRGDSDTYGRILWQIWKYEK